MGCQVFKQGVQNQNIFHLRINTPKANYIFIFENGCSNELQKLGIILVIQLFKNVNNKKCTPKLVLINEKKIERDLDD